MFATEQIILLYKQKRFLFGNNWSVPSYEIVTQFFLVFMWFLQMCWPWLGYSFILIIAIFFTENNISIKLFNFFRTAVGFDWICAFWGSAGLPEKEPWIKRHLLQRPGYQTTNKSDVTAADEVCLANCWWNELLVRKICKFIKNTRDKQF